MRLCWTSSLFAKLRPPLSKKAYPNFVTSVTCKRCQSLFSKLLWAKKMRLMITLELTGITSPYCMELKKVHALKSCVCKTQRLVAIGGTDKKCVDAPWKAKCFRLNPCRDLKSINQCRVLCYVDDKSIFSLWKCKVAGLNLKMVSVFLGMRTPMGIRKITRSRDFQRGFNNSKYLLEYQSGLVAHPNQLRDAHTKQAMCFSQNGTKCYGSLDWF